MIAARKAAKTDNLGSENPPALKMPTDRPRRKLTPRSELDIANDVPKLPVDGLGERSARRTS
jgi:hypothetical protein